MSRREKELEQALKDFDRTGDEELDALIDTADDLTAGFAVPTPSRPEGRAMFIEGVGARKRSIMSSLALPGVAVLILLLAVAVLGRSAVPGDSLYPVRKVLLSAGLADAPDEDIQKELDNAALLLGRARTALDDDPAAAERLAVSSLMSLGRAEGYLDQVGERDRVRFEGQIDTLRIRAVTLVRLSAVLDDDDSGKGSDDSSDKDDNSGSGSDGSGGDDNSGPGSDDSDGSGSGSDDSDNSGPASDDSGSDNSGSGSDDSGGDRSGSGDDD